MGFTPGLSLGLGLGSAAALAAGPAVPGSLIAWYDFSKTSSLTLSGSNITSAADLSGNGRTVTNSGSTHQPTVSASQFGGVQAAYFNGGQWLTTGPFGSDLPQPITMFVVARLTGNGLTTLVDGASSGGRCASFLYGNQWSAYAGGFQSELPLADYPANYVMCYAFNGSSSLMWRNGGATRGTTATPYFNWGTQGLGGITVGSDSGQTNFPLTGWIGEVLIYSGALTDAQRNQTTLYLSQKWNRSVYLKPTYGTLPSGQGWVLMVPGTYKSGNSIPLIYFHHGHGGLGSSVYSDSVNWTCVQALQSAGYWIAACDGAPTQSAAAAHWGNPESVTCNKEFDAYLTGQISPSRVMLWGESMGGLSSLNTLLDPQFNARVKGCYWQYPAVSVYNIYGDGYNGTDGNFPVEILAAYGAANQAALVPYDIVQSVAASAFPGACQYYFSASPNDTVISKAHNADELYTLLNSRSPSVSSLTEYASTGDHGDASNFRPSQMVSFMDTCV